MNAGFPTRVQGRQGYPATESAKRPSPPAFETAREVPEHPDSFARLAPRARMSTAGSISQVASLDGEDRFRALFFQAPAGIAETGLHGTTAAGFRPGLARP
jgi:hypothetical protein